MAYVIPFDTLAFAKELETAGVPKAQAEAHARVMASALQQVKESRLEELATKRDIEMAIEIAKVEIIRWTVGMFAAQSALIIGAMFVMVKMNQPSLPPIPYHVPPAQEMRQQPPQEMRLPAPVPPGQ